MKALILAAGLGERMRPLTNTTPKPLLNAGGKPLMAWHIEKLAAIGVHDIVVNTSWLAEQFPQVLGDGGQWDVRLHYSYEGPTSLETGGGMWHARTLLGDAPFIAVNGDIWTDFDFATLPREPTGDAHLVLVYNPAHHPAGDFALHDDAVASYKPDFLSRWLRRSRELADGFEDVLDLFIVPFKALFQLYELEGQLLVRRNHLTESHKYPHDRNVHLNGPFAVKDACPVKYDLSRFLRNIFPWYVFRYFSRFAASTLSKHASK